MQETERGTANEIQNGSKHRGKAEEPMIRRTACLIARELEPCRNLAIEKHLMDTLPEDTAILYLWRNERAILVGRGQNLREECRADAFLSENGRLARRMSGGGTAWLDMGTLGFTFLMPKTAFDISYQLNLLGMALGALGIQARVGTRGDLYAMGGRFSTSAYFKSGSAAYHHGTLLIDADLDAMRRFLPRLNERSEQVCNLRAIQPDVTAEEVEQALYWAFARAYNAQPAWLDEQMLDSRSIDTLTQRFEDRKWILPDEPPFTFSVAERFPWGDVTVRLNVEGGIIRAARVYTDAMEAPLFERIEELLTGTPFLISAISGRFEQRLQMIGDHRLLQLSGDVCKLICGHIRTLDRQ